MNNNIIIINHILVDITHYTLQYQQPDSHVAHNCEAQSTADISVDAWHLQTLWSGSSSFVMSQLRLSGRS